MVKYQSLCFCLPHYNAEVTYWAIFADSLFINKYLGTKPLTKSLHFWTRTQVFDSSWFLINNLGFYIQVSLQSVFFVSLKTFRKWNNVSLQRREKRKLGRGKLITCNAFTLCLIWCWDNVARNGPYSRIHRRLCDMYITSTFSKFCLDLLNYRLVDSSVIQNFLSNLCYFCGYW